MQPVLAKVFECLGRRGRLGEIEGGKRLVFVNLSAFEVGFSHVPLAFDSDNS
jgi:hypothetical protein